MSQNKDDDQIKHSGRRNFLKLASVGTVAGGAAALLGSPANAATKSTENGAGYAETKHVQTYYQSTKF